MSLPHTLLTGAAGNLGAKLRRRLAGKGPLTLIDRDPAGDSGIFAADLSVWNTDWSSKFQGAEAVVHLAGNPTAHATWAELIAPNLDALAFTLEAAAQAGVRRFIFASSNHVMGRYKDDTDNSPIRPDSPPRPGALYRSGGEDRDSTPYASAKLFGERLGYCYAQSRGMEVVAVRIGWVWRGSNVPEDLPTDREAWFHDMWLSDLDFCRLMECCLTASLKEPFVIINAMSNNKGMRWDLAQTCEAVGFEPVDGKL